MRIAETRQLHAARTRETGGPPPVGVSVFPAASAMVWPGPGHTHELLAVPGVRLAPGDVLVEVELTTVSEADVRIATSRHPSAAPLILGREVVGRVCALGQGGARTVDGRRLTLSARVVWLPTVPCGRCSQCRHGSRGRCLDPQTYGAARMRRGWELSGGFATHVHILAGTSIMVVPEELPATVLAPVASVTAAADAVLEELQSLAPIAGTGVLIRGAGALGLTTAAMATDAGARVVVSDPDPVRRERAFAFGASTVADPAALAPSPMTEAASLARAGGVGRASVVDFGTSEPADHRNLEHAVAYLSEAWTRFPFGELVRATYPLIAVEDALAAEASGAAIRIGISPRQL